MSRRSIPHRDGEPLRAIGAATDFRRTIDLRQRERDETAAKKPGAASRASFRPPRMGGACEEKQESRKTLSAEEWAPNLSDATHQSSRCSAVWPKL